MLDVVHILFFSLLILAVVSSTHIQNCSSVFNTFFFKSDDLPPDSEVNGKGTRANYNSSTEQQQQASPSKSLHRAALLGAGGGGVALPHLTRTADAGELLQAMNSINRCSLPLRVTRFFYLKLPLHPLAPDALSQRLLCQAIFSSGFCHCSTCTYKG
jgi:hypothetical protein